MLDEINPKNGQGSVNALWSTPRTQISPAIFLYPYDILWKIKLLNYTYELSTEQLSGGL